jgi:hypothetical protein
VGTTLEGLVIPYEQVSNLFGTAPVLFKNGAFTRGLRGNPDIAVTHEGRAGRIIGRTKSGTARVWEDDAGLHVEAHPPEGVSWADDLLVSVGRGDISSASAACVVSARLEKRGSDDVLIVSQAQVLQIAVTSFSPFNGGLTAQKSEAASAEVRQLEALYRK